MTRQLLEEGYLLLLLTQVELFATCISYTRSSKQHMLRTRHMWHSSRLGHIILTLAAVAEAMGGRHHMFLLTTPHLGIHTSRSESVVTATAEAHRAFTRAARRRLIWMECAAILEVALKALPRPSRHCPKFAQPQSRLPLELRLLTLRRRLLLQRKA